MRNHILNKNYTAGAAIAAYRIVKWGAADGEILQAAAATDALVGVNDRFAAAVAGDRLDITRTGLAEVEYGGNVTRGDLLTADAQGRAITAAPAAAAFANIIGIAEVSGVSGDIGSVLIAPGQVRAAAA